MKATQLLSNVGQSIWLDNIIANRYGQYVDVFEKKARAAA